MGVWNLSIEAEDDLVLVIVGITRPKYLRAEVPREVVGGGEDAGDPLLELSLMPRLHLSRGHRRDRWVFPGRRVSIIIDKFFHRMCSRSFSVRTRTNQP